MKKVRLISSALIGMALLVVLAVAFQSCNEDDGPTAIIIDTLLAGSSDINGATVPSDVPVDASIVATFNTEVDAATATSANITLLRDYDQANIDIDITVSGKMITITPSEPFGTGTLYALTIGGLKSTGGLTFVTITRSFTTVGTFSPNGVIAHWNFEDNANDIVGSFDPTASQIVDLAFDASRNTAAGKAGSFNGTTSIVEISNGDQLMNANNFTLSFWVKANSTLGKGQFVMGLGAFYGFQFEMAGNYSNCKLAASYATPANADGVSEDLWFPGDGKDKDNGGWQGWDFVKDLTGTGGVEALLKDKWAHVVCTYNGETKQGTMYINGEKMKGQDFDLWPDGDAKRQVTGLKYRGATPDVVNELAFGFIHSRAGTLWDAEPWGGYAQTGANHFHGLLDDVRVFHKALTAQEISLMYNSEKP